MGILDKLRERNRRRAHAAHVEEKERQAQLNREDAQQRVKDVANKTGPFTFPYGGGT
jgi:hypothetical protein